MTTQPHISVLTCNFAGLTTARYIRVFAADDKKITCIGHTLTNTFNGNEKRTYIHEGRYKGGPVAIDSDRFIKGKNDKLTENLPFAKAVCERPPVEEAFSRGSGLENCELVEVHNLPLYTPVEIIAEYTRNHCNLIFNVE